MDDGNKKIFRLIAKSYDDQEFAFDLSMEKRSNSWKITRLNNLGEVCTTFKNFSKESLISYLENCSELEVRYITSMEKLQDIDSVPELLKGRRQAEKDRETELTQIKTNPFSDILILISSKNFKYPIA